MRLMAAAAATMDEDEDDNDSESHDKLTMTDKSDNTDNNKMTEAKTSRKETRPTTPLAIHNTKRTMDVPLPLLTVVTEALPAT